MSGPDASEGGVPQPPVDRQLGAFEKLTQSPIAGFAVASAMPRAAEIPTRNPVKLPGPTVTAMRSRLANSQRAASITRAMSGITASA